MFPISQRNILFIQVSELLDKLWTSHFSQLPVSADDATWYRTWVDPMLDALLVGSKGQKTYIAEVFLKFYSSTSFQNWEELLMFWNYRSTFFMMFVCLQYVLPKLLESRRDAIHYICKVLTSNKKGYYIISDINNRHS